MYALDEFNHVMGPSAAPPRPLGYSSHPPAMRGSSAIRVRVPEGVAKSGLVKVVGSRRELYRAPRADEASPELKE